MEIKDKNNIEKKAWVVAANMGYGHQRTAYPLRDMAFNGEIINANSYDGIPKKDKKIWETTRVFYEFISRFKGIPYVGNIMFLILDKFQRILNYYPKRDLSGINFSLRSTFSFIKRKWGKDLIEKFEKKSAPIVSTFFTPAFMAEEAKYSNSIYCVICDADVARTWASLYPKSSEIKYFAPCTWARDRLILYGVLPQNIFLSGYPLPKENIGTEKMEILKEDLKNRLVNLDPLHRYRKMYQPLIKGYLGQLPEKSDHPLTILFSIGGAGAQKDIGLKIIISLKEKIKAKMVKVIVSVGIREDLRQYYTDNVKGLELDGWVHILSGKTMEEYFDNFNLALRKTDILWTKPSELSFYSGLGIPIIIAPPIGSQENFNKRWLLHVGSATPQEDPKYTDQWLFDLLYAGDLAELAMQGFVEIPKLGTFNIEKKVLRVEPFTIKI